MEQFSETPDSVPDLPMAHQPEEILMTRNLLTLISTLILVLVLSAPAHAGGRPDGSSGSWFGQIGTGWSFPTGDSDDFLNSDWTIGGGALFWPSDWPVGISLDVNYLNTKLSGSTIRAINDIIDQDPDNEGNISGGDVENWQFALNGILSLGPQQDSGLYLTGGITYNRVEGRISQTGLVYYPPICDPWFWWCIPGGIGPGTIVVGTRSENEFGWNVGAGYSFDTWSGGKVFIEARYQQIQFGRENLEYIPLTVGYRW
jgi:opacity protein-like surface antigen